MALPNIPYPDVALAEDAGRVTFGDDQDHWLQYDSANSKFVIANSSGTALEIADSGDDVHIPTGNLTVGVQTIGVDLCQMYTHDAPGTPLPSAAANDDLGIIVGSPGTNALRLETNDEGQTGSEQDFYAGFNWVVPPSYKAGSTVTVNIHGGMLVVADQASTSYLDLSAWVPDYANADSDDNTVSSDLVTTAPITAFNSATFATHSFTVDDDVSAHVLVPGSVVQFRVKVAVDDNNTATANVTGVITKIDIVISA